MPNTFVTPEWITREALELLLEANRPIIGQTIKVRLPKRFQVNTPPVSGKALLALGAAAVIANPEPISRRSLFGLGWWRRHAREK